MDKKPHIIIIYTGGTIGMFKDFQTNALRNFDFEQIYDNIPELNHLHCSIETVSFEPPIDSSNMNTDKWNEILCIIEKNYINADGFVVLHGSDTMAYTASALSFMIENLGKPIIFTGSQLPIGDLRTDAKENMITAIELAALQENNNPVIQEVCVYFEYKLYRANRTTKISASQFRAFDSPNYPILAESGVELKVNYQNLLQPSVENSILKFKKIESFPIALIKIFPGINEDYLKNLLLIPHLKGVIIETFGSGNAPTEAWFLTLLKQTLDAKIPVIDITQCVSGSVVLGKYETSIKLLEMGLIDGKDITTEAAVTKLNYILSCSEKSKNVKYWFEKNIRGEISE